MNTETKRSARTDYFRTLYENARDRHAASDALFERHMQQYRGSDELDGAKERAGTVRNITYEIIESQVSSEIPPPKTEPTCYSEKKDRNAKSVERLCASVRSAGRTPRSSSRRAEATHYCVMYTPLLDLAISR